MTFWRKKLESLAQAGAYKSAVVDELESLSWRQILALSDELSSSRNLNRRSTVILAVPRNAKACALTAAVLAGDFCGLTIDRNSVRVALPSILKLSGASAIVIQAGDSELLGEIIGDFEARPLSAISGLAILYRKQVDAPTISAKWLLQTSGSTRIPRLVMISDDELVDRAIGEVRDFQISDSDEILNALPLSHDVGFNQILAWIASNGILRVHSRFSVSELRQVLDRNTVTGMSGTPLLWLGLLRDLTPEYVNSKLRFFTVSGGSLDVETLQRLRGHFPSASVIKTYGQTETFRSLISRIPPNADLTNSLGRPMVGVDLSLTDEMGKSVPTNTVGQLVHRGAGTMMGYLGSSEETAKVLTSHGISTGDYFSCNEAGEYFFSGRRDDLVKRWEHRLFLSEVELAVKELSEVESAAAVARSTSDARQNELVVYVTLRPDSNMATPDSIRLHCKNVLAAHKIPDRVFILPELPKTSSLKVDRRKLLELWEAEDVKR